jgi:4-hydroxy 2-oxovalerate aldolase
VAGAPWLDSTIAGLGRGAGNCPTELPIGFLKNPRFPFAPCWSACRSCSSRSKHLDWSYSIPYMLTGQLNIQPRMAIAVRDSDSPDAYVEFYDRLTENTDCVELAPGRGAHRALGVAPGSSRMRASSWRSAPRP